MLGCRRFWSGFCELNHRYHHRRIQILYFIDHDLFYLLLIEAPETASISVKVRAWNVIFDRMKNTRWREKMFAFKKQIAYNSHH